MNYYCAPSLKSVQVEGSHRPLFFTSYPLSPRRGRRIVRHFRQILFQLAEVTVSRETFAHILDRGNRLRPVSICDMVSIPGR